MCNQAVGLSRCLTRVQDAMSTQLKNLHQDKGEGKSSERTQQALDELEYLVTFNRSISQAMARTMQDLSEGICISMANFTLAHRDSYLEYLHAGVKQDTLTELRTAPVHLQSLFLDQLIIKAEEEVFRSEERRSSGQSHRKQGHFHPYASNDRSTQQPDWKSSIPAWKQIRQTGKERLWQAFHFLRNRPRVLNHVNDNYCVCYWTEGLCLCVRSDRFEPFTSDGRKQRLHQQEQDCKFTCKLLCCKCSFCCRVATKERRNSQLLSQLHRKNMWEMFPV